MEVLTGRAAPYRPARNSSIALREFGSSPAPPASRCAKIVFSIIPLFTEDYYLLGKRETIERSDMKAVVTSLQSPDFAAQVRNIPGYDISGIGGISSVADVIG